MPVYIQNLFIFSSLLLISCASTEQHRTSDTNYSDSAAAGSYKFDAWRLTKNNDYMVINGLLEEADVLIGKKSYNAAVDKLERVLRIKPGYAPAWSRLSWLSLQTNAAKRSVQMAKRSNSLVHADPELQTLNWTFIRSASQMLNDKDSYDQAVMKIESLKAF